MNAFLHRAASALAVTLFAVALQSCETMQSENSVRREQMNAAIRQEVPGNYFIGRRFYKDDYKMWGWVRQPGQPGARRSS